MIDQLVISNSDEHVIDHDAYSPNQQQPLTSILDHQTIQTGSSRLIQDQPQSNTHIDDENRSASLSPISFETYGYPTPSMKIRQISTQSLSSTSKKSVNTQQSRHDLLIDNVKENQSKPNVRKCINQIPISFQTHVSEDFDSQNTTFSQLKLYKTQLNLFSVHIFQKLCHHFSFI